MEVRVPGKVMLTGEYAVLYGGTAVMVPVERSLTLTAIDEPGPDAENPVLNEALHEPIPELEVMEADLPPLHVHADRSEFMIQNRDGSMSKLGLGGSAAEAVAAIALRFSRCGQDWTTIPETIHHYAAQAHKRAQGGVGSGADVAAIAYRKPIRFRTSGEDVNIEIIPKPADHHLPKLSLLWTGRSADTRDLVGQFQHWVQSYPNVDALLDILVKQADQTADAWFTTELPQMLHEIDEYYRTMESFTDLAGMTWMLPTQREIRHWARELGGMAKPTGAGGGDMMLIAGNIPVERRPELTIGLDPFADHMLQNVSSQVD